MTQSYVGRDSVLFWKDLNTMKKKRPTFSSKFLVVRFIHYSSSKIIFRSLPIGDILLLWPHVQLTITDTYLNPRQNGVNGWFSQNICIYALLSQNPIPLKYEWRKQMCLYTSITKPYACRIFLHMWEDGGGGWDTRVCRKSNALSHFYQQTQCKNYCEAT